MHFTVKLDAKKDLSSTKSPPYFEKIQLLKLISKKRKEKNSEF